MTQRANEHFDDRLDAFLDDLMDARDREAFERELQDHPDLRVIVAQHDAIDASIRRTCMPPSEEALRAIALRALNASGTARRSSRVPASLRPWAAAAALALCVTGTWMIWTVVSDITDRRDPYAQPWRSMAAVYEDQRDIMKPDWVCDNDPEFRAAFEGRFGQPLLLAALPENVAALGLCYSNTISKRTFYLLAEVNDTPVLVFVDRVENDSGKLLEKRGTLHAHRSEVDDLVLYEVTPFEQPHMLPYFYNPDKGSQS